MMRAFALVAGSLVLLVPGGVQAAGDDCPDGWFCEEPSPEPAPTEPPPPPPAPQPPKVHVYPARPAPTPPPNLQVTNEPEEPRVARQRRGRWGFNLHVEKPLLGSGNGKSPDASLAGLGAAVRRRLLRSFAVEAGVDFVGGTDWQGYDRSEQALVFHAIGSVNPRDLLCVYGLAGFGFSHATVTIRPLDGQLPFSQYDVDYWYTGADLGLGVALRVSRNITLDADLIGLMRFRIDDNAASQPEFIDPVTHRATNTSGAGLLRLGASFYW